MITISRSTRLVLVLLTAATIAWGTQWGGHAQSASALQFNGTNQYVTFGAAPGLGAATFTIEVWFKRTGTGATTTTSASGGGGLLGAIPLLTKGRGEGDMTNVDMNYFLGINAATNTIAADFEEGVTANPGLNHAVIGSTPIVNNVWYHAAATYDGQTLRIFLNGVQDGSVTLATPRAPRFDSIQHAALGSALTSTGGPAGFFAGVLDEARIWSVARTQAQIQSTKGQEITSATGLIGRWGLNEGSGTTVTGVGPNGTLTSTLPPPATPPTWGAGLVLTGAAPPVPQNLSASRGNGLVTIAWNGTSQPDLIGYNVYRSTSTPVPTNVAPLNASPAPIPIYTDRPVTNGTTYYYAVTTVFPSGESGASNEAFATPDSFAGSALQFNGSDQHVTFGAAPGLGTATFTLETWFKRTGNGIGTNTGSGGITDVIPLISKGRAQADNSNNLDANYIFGIQASTGRLAADFEDTVNGGNHPVVGQTPIDVSTTAWHHAAATYDGMSWRLYLDGVLDQTLSVGFTPRFDSIQHAALATAMNSTGGADGRFAGVLEEVRIWNYPRSQAQIQASMYQEITSASGLLGRWGMNEATGTANTADSSGNLNTGTFSSAGPTWTAGYPFIADGTAPAPPNNVVAAPGIQAITLGWSANSEADLAGYNVYRSTTSPVSTFTSPINSSLLTSPGYNDTGLTNGTTYYYVLTAVDIFGNASDPSTEASATPQVPNLPPAADAGADQSVARPNQAMLAGSATDDGLPSATLNVTWSVHTGPSGVTFGSANAVSTTASFSTAGTYVLRLTASDGVLSASDDMTVVVSNPVLVGAGDIAPDCTASASIANAQATGVLLNGISGTVFTAGDNAYQDGTTQQFVQCYDAAWGSVRARTRPATGNHDYNPNPAKGAGNNANPYFDYFNGDGSPTGPAGDRDKGYYSYDIENWHVVVLNSECGTPGLWNVNGCAVGSAQEVWLRADLANSSTNNIIAIWHKPRFSSSAADGAIAFMQPLWQALYEYGVDIVLGGHWHNYERLAPTDANGLQDDAFGIRQFIVGTGGVAFSNFGTVRGTSEVRQNSDHGVLKLTLHADSYAWEFVPIPGKTFNDAGTGSVHGPPPPPSIAGLAPPGGSPAGGTLVTITGSDFGNLTPTTVLFGTTPATNVNCSSATVCTATSPAGTGTVDVTVIVGGQTSATHSLAKFTYNVAPAVGAGIDQNISSLDTTLSGTATDDGQPNPPGTMTIGWSRVSGSGTVTFGSPSSLSTTATFSTVGTYVLRLTANDGLFASSDDVTVRVTTDPGGANKALQFNGSSQYVTLGPGPELGSTIFTIETWFKREGTGSPADTGANGVIAVPLVTKGRNQTDGSNVDMNYFLGINADRVLVADFEDQASGANHPVTGNRRIADGVWYHAAATYDGTRWRLYVNGVLDVESAAIGATPRSDSIQHAAIGSALNSTGVANGFFAGVIDEARIWSVARSGADIAATMASAITAAPNLVGRWGLNEGAGDVATDDAGVANDGTLNGSPGWVDGTPFAPTPLVGNHGVTFNGSSDYVTFGQAPGLGAATFTIETWFKRTGTGVGTSTGAFTGTQAIPLVTKGRGQADGSNLDANYFLGIHADTGVLIADFENTASGANSPINGTTAIPISATAWHHAAVTYDGSTLSLFLDGQLEESLTLAGDPIPRFDSIQHAAIATAINSEGTAAGFFAGVLDEARIWNYARSQSQIDDGMSRAITDAPGLLGRWGFDTAFGVVNDTTGNDHVGTLFGPAWNWVIGAPFTSPTNLAPIVDAGSDQTIMLPDAASVSGSVSDDSVTGTVTQTWTKVSGPGTVTFQDPAAIATIAVFSASGTYELRLSANDGELVSSDTLTVTVNSGPVNQAPIVDAGGDQAITTGTTASLAGSVTDDGLPGIDVDVEWTQVSGPGTVTFDDATAAATVASFSAIGSYVLRFSADDGQLLSSDTLTVTVNPSASNNALDLGGTNAYVNLGPALGLGTSTFTLELWFRRDGTGVTTGTGTGGLTAVPLVSKGMAQADGSNVDMNYFFGISSTNVLAADFEDSATGLNHPVSGTTPIPADGQWHHGAATYDGTTWRLYLDGVIQNTLVIGNFTPRADSIQWGAIGSASDSAGGITSGQRGFFAGAVDEVRIWNHARSPQQIADSLNDEISSAAGLIGRWGFNEGAGATVADSSGSGVSGNLVGTNYAWTAGAPFSLNAAPDQPTLNAPTNGATNLPTSPLLDVSVSDPDLQPLTVTFFGRPVTAASAPEFTIVALPDTQHYVDDVNRAPTFTAQTQWIVNNKAERNIAFVTHLGDIVEHIDAQPVEWDRADLSLTLLQANDLKWGLAPGNHDLNSSGVGAGFDAKFPASRFFGVFPWYGGYLGSDPINDPIDRGNKDNYELFSVGGLDFIIIHLEYDMPDYSVAWANRILAQYPNRRAIITTHLFLNASGVRPTTVLNRTNGTPAETVWQQLVRPNCNVFLVLNGHYPGEANRTDSNVCGNPVHQLASDYQSRTNGGDGWLRYMVFKPSENKIHVFTYSPTLNGGLGLFETDGNSQFVLDYEMQGTSFSMIATNSNVPSGSSTTTTWSNLGSQSEHEWYVTVGDGFATTTSPVSRFTTTGGALHHLVLSPASASISAGGSQTYTAEGFDDANNSLGDVTSSTTFSISPNGSCTGATCTATAIGAHTVTGTNGVATGTANLTVSAGSLHHMVLSPATGSITAGGSQSYSAEGRDSFDNSLGTQTGVAYSIAPDGSCTGSACTASVAGSHTVTGTKGTATGSATLTVDAGGLHHLVLSPTTASIAAGGSQNYTADGRDSFENSLGAQSGVTYSITPNGSCTAASCTATVVGAHTVTGTKGTATGTASLTVNAGPLHHLLLSPAAATISEGGNQAYTAQGRDQFENSLGDVTGATTFSIAPDGACTLAACGASLAGPHTVTGTNGTATGTASLTVIHANVPPVAAAATATTAQDTAATLTLSATDSDSPALTFAIVTGPTRGTLGSLSAPSCSGAPVTCTTTVVFTPALDYNGPDSFTFRASDGADVSSAVTASITVNPAAILFRAASFAQNGGASSVTLTKPASVVADDLMLASIVMSGAATITPPSGWSLVRDPGNNVALDTTSGTLRHVVYFKVAGSAEPSSYTWSLSASRNGAGGLAAYSGVSTISPFDIAGGQANPSSASITTPSLNTSIDNTRLVALFGIAANTSITPPSRMSERGEVTGGKVKVATEIADVNQTAMAAGPARVATAGSAAVNVGQLVALRPVGTPDIQPPAPPASLTATAGNAQVTLNWSPSATATVYNVYRSTTAGGAEFLDSTTAPTTTYLDSLVTNGTTYYYVVKAGNDNGEGLPSPEASATPVAPCASISLTPTSLSGGTVGSQYNQAITATGGTAPYLFTLTAGTLPPGVTLSNAGVLSGTPKNNAGNKTYTFTVTATAGGCSGSHQYTVSISR